VADVRRPPLGRFEPDAPGRGVPLIEVVGVDHEGQRLRRLHGVDVTVLVDGRVLGVGDDDRLARIEPLDLAWLARGRQKPLQDRWGDAHHVLSRSCDLQVNGPLVRRDPVFAANHVDDPCRRGSDREGDSPGALRPRQGHEVVPVVEHEHLGLALPRPHPAHEAPLAEHTHRGGDGSQRRPRGQVAIQRAELDGALLVVGQDEEEVLVHTIGQGDAE